jgi:hypothetical protein
MLTSRGRIVAAIALMVLAALTATLLALAAAGGVQAASHRGPARSGYQGLTRAMVRPGQTLWALAVAAEPSADPRLVIQQIMDVNGLRNPVIHAGELLWVPKG